jgi:hypothetical protein
MSQRSPMKGVEKPAAASSAISGARDVWQAWQQEQQALTREARK